MCIPPQNLDPKKYFKIMSDLNKSLGLKELVWECPLIYEAIKYGSTFVRIGSKIFGKELRYFYFCFLLINLIVLKNHFLLEQCNQVYFYSS